jgi:hypothetical protein
MRLLTICIIFTLKLVFTTSTDLISIIRGIPNNEIMCDVRACVLRDANDVIKVGTLFNRTDRGNGLFSLHVGEKMALQCVNGSMVLNSNSGPETHFEFTGNLFSRRHTLGGFSLSVDCNNKVICVPRTTPESVFPFEFTPVSCFDETQCYGKIDKYRMACELYKAQVMSYSDIEIYDPKLENGKCRISCTEQTGTCYENNGQCMQNCKWVQEKCTDCNYNDPEDDGSGCGANSLRADALLTTSLQMMIKDVEISWALIKPGISATCLFVNIATEFGQLGDICGDAKDFVDDILSGIIASFEHRIATTKFNAMQRCGVTYLYNIPSI